MTSVSEMTVEVAFALPEKQTLLALQVPVNTTVIQAVESSGILDLHPEIDLARQKLGIFGRLAKPSEVLRPGDRVEIYRPLKADPKEVRRRLAAEGKTMGKSDKMDDDDGRRLRVIAWTSRSGRFDPARRPCHRRNRQSGDRVSGCHCRLS